MRRTNHARSSLALALAVFTTALFDSTARASAPTGLDRLMDEVRTDLGPELALVSVRPHRPVAADAHEVSIQWNGVPRAGAQSVAITVIGRDGAAAKSWAEVRLARRALALVAARPLRAGETAEVGAIVREWTTAPSGAALEVDPAEVADAKVLRDLARGEVLGPKDVELAPPLARGAVLRVIVEVGTVRVASEGVLERGARAGQEAIARLKATNRLVRGTLVDRETLVVRGGAL